MQGFKRRTVLKCAAALALVLAAGGRKEAGEKFVLVSPAPNSDSGWNTHKDADQGTGGSFNVQVV